MASPDDTTRAGLDITPNALRPETTKLRPITDLHCYICTPTPSFTNTSHLLTHLASKSHLRALFELELCATECKDEGCSRALEKYHAWYYAESVGEHLVDRFIIKKGKWSREKLKSDAEELTHEEGLETIMVDEAETLRQQEEENVVVNDGQALWQQDEENVNERGLAEKLIAAINEDRKRKREDFSSPTRPGPRLKVDTTSIATVAAKGGASRSSFGRRPLASLVNEVPVGLTQKPVEGQRALPSHNTPSGQSNLGMAKADEARLRGLGLETEEETDIIEGPDKGVTYSQRGPRLRGKIWPGMSVFDCSVPVNFSRTAQNTTNTFSPSGVSLSTTSVKEKKSSSHLHKQSASPGPLYIQGLLRSTATPNEANLGAIYETISVTPARRLEQTGTPIELIFHGVDEIDAEVDNDSDLDVDGEYELDEDYGYILGGDLERPDGDQQTEHPIASNSRSNITFPVSQTSAQRPKEVKNETPQDKTSTVDAGMHAYRTNSEQQFGQWQPANPFDTQSTYLGSNSRHQAEPNRTNSGMTIGSLLNEVTDQDVTSDSIEDGGDRVIHVAHHMNLDTLNQSTRRLQRHQCPPLDATPTHHKPYRYPRPTRSYNFSTTPTYNTNRSCTRTP